MNRLARIGLTLLLLVTALPAPELLRAQTDSAETARLESQKRKELEDIKREAQEKRAAAGKLKGQETKVLGELPAAPESRPPSDHPTAAPVSKPGRGHQEPSAAPSSATRTSAAASSATW